MLWVSAKNQMHPCSPINSEPANNNVRFALVGLPINRASMAS